jgi:hypothetical protein
VRQLNWLLDGLDFTKLTGYKSLEYSTFFVTAHPVCL